MMTSPYRRVLVLFSLFVLTAISVGIALSASAVGSGDVTFLQRVTELIGVGTSPVAADRDSTRTSAPSSGFSAGDIVVYRVDGNGSSLTSNAAAVFLDEYTTAGTPVQSIAMPTTVNGVNKRLVASGSATSEGLMTRSADGKYLIVPGYDAAVGTGSITSSNTNTVSRVVGRVDPSAVVDTTTAMSDTSAPGNIRGATSTNGTDIWISTSAGGVKYLPFGAASTSTVQLSSAPANTRSPEIFNGQLYITAATGAFQGVSTIGTGTPTTSGQSTTQLPGFPTASGPSPYQFFQFDASTIYVADDRTVASGGGIQKWTSSGGTWSLAYTLNTGLTAGMRGLIGTASGGQAILYGTTADNPAKLVTLTDTGSTAAITVLATAAANTTFRGLAFAPIAPVAKQFQSAQAGDWNQLSTWNESTDGGVSFHPATSIPTSADGQVSIGHNVSLSGNQNASSVVTTGGFGMRLSGTGTLSISGDFTSPQGLFGSGVTFVFNGNGNTQTVSTATPLQNVTVKHSGAGSVTADSLSTNGFLWVQTGTLNLSGGPNISGLGLQIDSGATLTLVNSTNLNLNADWNNNGTFVPNSSLVSVGAEDETFSGSNTFYDLNVLGFAGVGVYFAPASTTTVTHSLTLQGQTVDGTKLVLRSTSTGSQWKLNLQAGATQSVNLVDVEDSDASAGLQINPTNSINSGNNLNWNFPVTYTVTYNGNGNTGGTAPTDVNSPYVSGSTVTVLGNTGGLTKTGFSFVGWNTAANGSGTPYQPGATFTISGNTTLYAQYGIPTYTVTKTADTNDGVCDSDCSLREAITAANASSDSNPINFAIPAGTDPGCVSATGVCTITPTSPLPTVTAPVTINGYSQPGAAVNTNPFSAGDNAQIKIELSGANLTTESGNSVFTNAGLTFANGSDGSTVSGLVINRFGDGGIVINPSPGNTAGNITFTGNFIGTSADGTSASGNTTGGIVLIDSGNDVIGGTTAGARNVISGNIWGSNHGNNPQANVWAFSTGANSNDGHHTIQGNYIGTNAAGTAGLSANTFSEAGIDLQTLAGNNIVGGINAGNLVSGNGNGGGIRGFTDPSTTIQGNLIGTKADGTGSVPNVDPFAPALQDGINFNGNNVLVGGTTAGTGNTVKHQRIGISVSGLGATVQGNTVDLNQRGIITTGSNGTVSGNTSTNNAFNGFAYGINVNGSGNLVSGNTVTNNDVAGIIVSRNNNTVNGNTITGTTARQPSTDGQGVLVSSAFGPSNNTISQNIIHDNAGEGVVVGDFFNTCPGNTICATGNTVTGNQIYNNGRLGIDIAPQGVTPNDPGDADGGNNNQQNFPAIASVLTSGSTTITGSLNSTPNHTYKIEFFTNSSCDPSGNGEGQTPIDTISSIATDANGNAAINLVTASPVAIGTFVTATATDNATHDTSEFSQCVVANGSYTVTYNGNGNTGGTAPTDPNSPYGSNSTVTVLGPGTLVKTNYQFVNWNTVADGTGTSYNPGSTFSINGNTTLYAQWQAVPTINVSTNGPLAFGSVTVGNNSVPQSYTVSGSNLQGDIAVTAPGQFQVSTSPNSGFGGSVTLTQSSGTVNTTTIYVRYVPTLVGGVGPTVNNASTNASTQGVTVTGTGVAASCAAQPSGMVSWWQAENNALDRRGSGSGTMQNGATFAAGKVGQAFSLNESADTGGYVAAADSPAWHFGSNDFTIDFWTKLDQIKSTMFLEQLSGAGAGGWELNYQSGPGELFFNRDTNNTAIHRPWSPDTNTWYHLAVTRTSGTYRLYVNGVQLGAEQADANPVPSNTGELHMGNFVSTNAYDLIGELDEVEIFNRALTGTEISGIYNASTAGKCTLTGANGPTAWWAASGDARDVSGNGNDGVLQNGVRFAVGKVGQAFSFDGNQTYVQLPDNFVPYPTGGTSTAPMAFETWFKTTSGGVIFGQSAGTPFGAPISAIPAVYVGTDGKLYVQMFYGGGGSPNPVASSGTVNDGTFHHVAVSYDGTNETVYLDGVQIATTPFTQNGYTGTYHYQLGTGNALASSGWPAGTNSNNGWFTFNGLIDEASFYTRSLSSNEVQSIFDAGIAGKYKSVVTPTGANVQSNAGGDATLTFSTVTASGVTQQVPIDGSQYPAIPQPPLGLYYDISSSATFTGGVKVCFHLPLFTTSAAFSNVRIDHFESGSWVDRTDLSSLNFATRTACTTSLNSLSPFAIGAAAPTAAEVTISGRVLAPSGGGLRNASVVMTGTDGNTRRAVTNSFGYYTFSDVQSGGSYIMGVESRKYRYATRAVTITDSLANVDFTPVE